jgi:uncharacterized protein (TIGR02268 family)
VQPSLFLLLLLLLHTPLAFAQTPSASLEASTLRIHLPPHLPMEAHEVPIIPGGSTTFLFDSKLAEVGLELEQPERFERVRVAGDTLLLVPGQALQAGARLRLLVRFADGAAPASAAFTLVVSSAHAHQQVEVFRSPRPAAPCEAELREKAAEAWRCQEENARLGTRLTEPVSLMDLIVAGIIDGKGVIVWKLKGIIQRAGEPLLHRRTHGSRSWNRLVLEVELEAPGSGVEWTVAGAELTSPSGEKLQVVRVRQEPSPALGAKRYVLVEVAISETSPEGPFSLQLWNQGRAHTVTLDNFTFR